MQIKPVTRVTLMAAFSWSPVGAFHLLHSYVTLDLPQTTTTSFEQRPVPLFSRIIDAVDDNPRSHLVSTLLLAIAAVFLTLYLSACLLPRMCRRCQDDLVFVYELPYEKSGRLLQVSSEVWGAGEQLSVADTHAQAIRVGGSTGSCKRPALLCQPLARAYRTLDQRDERDFKRNTTNNNEAFLAAACRHTHNDRVGGACGVNHQVIHSKTSILGEEGEHGNSKWKCSKQFEI